MRSLFVCSAALALAAVLPAEALAETFTITPADDLIAAVAALAPGDELVLGGGTYNLTARFGIGVSGTEAAPIVIRAADGEVPIITRPDANQNVINFDGVAYVELRGVEVMGGSHGIRIDDSDFITIEDCHIHDTGDVGLSANVGGSDYEGLRFLGNHIHDTNNTGEGMYLGCNDNACQFHDAVIERNYIHHTNGPSVSQGDGIEIKEGSYNNLVRDNVIHDTNYPCILTYSTVGNGGPNRIERNGMWGCGDHGIQSAADAIIVNNIILSAAADGIRNQPHQAGDPNSLSIVHNTILKAGGDAIRSDGIVGTVTIANNAIYAQAGNAIRLSGDTSQVTVIGNVGVGSLSNVSGGFSATGSIASDFVAASFSGAPPNDVFPASGSMLIAAGDLTHVTVTDFNGTPRANVADAGAYKFDAAGNPGWTISAGFKDETGGPGPGGGGAGGAGAGGDGNGGGASGGGPAGSGGSAAGGSGGDGASGSEDGCGCVVVHDGSMGAGAWLFAAALMIARQRRRPSR